MSCKCRLGDLPQAICKLLKLGAMVVVSSVCLKNLKSRQAAGRPLKKRVAGDEEANDVVYESNCETSPSQDSKKLKK